MASETSVPRLYAAGVLPGLLIAGLLALYVVWFARRHGIGAGEAFDARRFMRASARGLWALGAPFIILGGIYGGVFAPTEAAGVACVYAACGDAVTVVLGVVHRCCGCGDWRCRLRSRWR